MQVKEIKSFFENSGLGVYNKFIESFPPFEAQTFSDFICDNKNHSEVINYYFHEIYPVLKNSTNPNHINSKTSMIKLLNECSHDALVLLWENKLPRIFNWYKDIDIIHSYFEVLEQDRILNLIIYLYNLELNKKDYPIHFTDALRNASALIIYLDEDSMSSFSEHEYFKLIVENFETNFNKSEIEVLFKIKPELVNLFNMKQSSDNFRYFATLHVSEKADIESILNILVLEYEECKDLLSKGFGYKQGNFYIKNRKIYLKYEYLLEMVELFPEQSRSEFLKSLFKIEFFNEILSTTQKESLEILVKENFKTLRDLRKNSL